MDSEGAAGYGLAGDAAPPFKSTDQLLQVTDAAKHPITLDLMAKIDKGFFKAEDNWTCYRRNYFSVACSYTLKPEMDQTTRTLNVHAPSGVERIQSFSVCISAQVDGESNKFIELVQHTPKRDKGPMDAPKHKDLLAIPSSVVESFPNVNPEYGHLGDLDHTYSPGTQENNHVATFDRMQFKKATANNGKRRAAQQFFQIVVELFVTTARSGPSGYKVATKESAPVVVRGRSPGHYQDEKRDRAAQMGPGGGAGGHYSHATRDANLGDYASGSTGMSYVNTRATSSGNYHAHHHGASLASSPPPPTYPMSTSSSSSFNSLGCNRAMISEQHAVPISSLHGLEQVIPYSFEPQMPPLSSQHTDASQFVPRHSAHLPSMSTAADHSHYYNMRECRQHQPIGLDNTFFLSSQTL